MSEEWGNSKEISFYEEKGRYKGVLSWLMSTDHKRIGIQYLGALLSFFAVGVSLGMIIRLSLVSPGWLFGAQTYDEIFSTHGIVMIFLFIIPGVPVAFGNFFLPIMIGARDVAFPRLNRFTWWLYLTGATIVALSLSFTVNLPIPDGHSTRLTV